MLYSPSFFGNYRYVKRVIHIAAFNQNGLQIGELKKKCFVEISTLVRKYISNHCHTVI